MTTTNETRAKTEVALNCELSLFSCAVRAGHKISNLRYRYGVNVVDLDGETMSVKEAFSYIRDRYTFRHIDGRMLNL
jgi:hypothetical protein